MMSSGDISQSIEYLVWIWKSALSNSGDLPYFFIPVLALGDPLDVAAVAGVHPDDIALVDKQRDLDGDTGFQLGRLVAAGNGISLESRGGIGYLKFDVSGI
jgi:hypothetical protein